MTLCYFPTPLSEKVMSSPISMTVALAVMSESGLGSVGWQHVENKSLGVWQNNSAVTAKWSFPEQANSTDLLLP